MEPHYVLLIWWLAGFVSFVVFLVIDHDVTLADIVCGLFAGFCGPVWLVPFVFKFIPNPTVIRKITVGRDTSDGS